MYIDKETKLRINHYAPYKGFSRLETPEQREAAGVIEIPDPARGNDEIEYTQELNEPPYIVITPKSQEQLDAQHNTKIKQQIAAIEVASTRALREAALGSPAFLTKVEAQIQDLRNLLKPEAPSAR